MKHNTIGCSALPKKRKRNCILLTPTLIVEVFTPVMFYFYLFFLRLQLVVGIAYLCSPTCLQGSLGLWKQGKAIPPVVGFWLVKVRTRGDNFDRNKPLFKSIHLNNTFYEIFKNQNKRIWQQRFRHYFIQKKLAD